MSHRNLARVTGHLKVVQRASGTVYYARTRVPGRQPEDRLQRLAPAGQLTRRQAEDLLVDLLADERRKLGHGDYDHPAVTFQDAAIGFLHHIEHVRGREQTTINDYQGSINTHLNPRWGTRPVTAITAGDVEQLRDELLAAGLNPRTVVRHLTVAHGVFKHAMRKHGLARNPASADLVDRPTVRYSGEFQTLDLEQLAALCRAATSPQDAILYLTAAQTGLRQGELRALAWRDIDFGADRIHVRHSARTGAHAVLKAPKSGKVRSVPMTPAVATALATLSVRDHFTDDTDIVFATVTGEIENDEQIRRRFRRALTAAGLPRVRFHDLRHVFGSTAVKTFVLSDVQAMLGHAHITTTMRYVHHRPGKDDGAKLAAAFESPGVPRDVPRTTETEHNQAKLNDTETAW